MMLISDPAPRARSLWIAIGLVGAIAIAFWTGSRYPRLDEKAQMAGIVPVEGPLTFESVFAVDPDASLPVRVLQTAVNWADGNLRGMIFGLLFAAALLTVAAFVRRRHDPGAAGATLLGVVIGSPLGVCVNCAAPIARGLHAAGLRLETTLAALVSSPTLNVVVLTMAFSLFPLYIVLVKLAVTVAFLLIAVPIIAWLSRGDVAPAGTSPAVTSASVPPLLTVDERKAFTGWTGATWAVLRTFARNLIWIARTTVPLMILAGFIGALVVEVVPWEHIVSFGGGITRAFTLVLMGALAVFGLILPVPIAFDVVIASALMQAGLPVRYMMPLLFTLGSFSVYSFLILWRGVSRRAALWSAVVLVGLGVVAGVAAHQLQKWERSRLQELVYSELDRITTPATFVTASAPQGDDLAGVAAARVRAPLSFNRVTELGVPGITVEAVNDVARSSAGERGFLLRDSDDTGLVLPPLFDGEDFIEPFIFSAGLAAGDVHGDGHVDVLVPIRGALMLFANRGNGRFVQQRIDAPSLSTRHLMNAALVDLDNDGWLDIVASAWGGDLWWLRNREGRFDGRDLHWIDNRGANLTAAFGFADLDRDGDLDAVLGNWHASLDIPPESARNWILRNDVGAFQYEPLSDMTGETLTTLITDLNADGWPDLAVGNDHGVSDLVYVGDSRGGLLDRSRAGEMFPNTGRSTMSIDSADLDNDGRLEILIAVIAYGDATKWLNAETSPPADACGQIRALDHRLHCERLVHVPVPWSTTIASENSEEVPVAPVENCMRTRDDRDRLICIGHHLLAQTIRAEGDKGRCAQLPATLPRFREVCERSFPVPLEIARPADANAIPQADLFNVLLERNHKDAWVDRADARGLDLTGWTWNAKFTDFDLDGWQDLYAANGWASSPIWESNLFYRNDGTGYFHEETAEMGLVDYLATSSYVVADFDGDGDPDIVTRPILGPLRLFENRAPAASARAATFELRDFRGNRFGIGATLTAHLADGTFQLRELKASGGFQSFDPPEARFGVGKRDAITGLDIRWSTGESTRLDGPFPVGSRYRITRAGPVPPG